METVDALKEKFPQLISPPSDDICYATQNRQIAVKQMGAEADLVIVVGSKNSSNSVRLVEVAKLAPARARPTSWTSPTRSTRPGWRASPRSASPRAPPCRRCWSSGVLEWLAERGFEDVEIVKAAEESITFSLPKELRRDLRAEAAALVAERTADDAAGRSGPGSDCQSYAVTWCPCRSSAWTSADPGSRALPWTWTGATWRRSATRC